MIFTLEIISFGKTTIFPKDEISLKLVVEQFLFLGE